MATKKKVANKTTIKSAQTKKTVAKKASTIKKAAKPAPAKKAAPAPVTKKVVSNKAAKSEIGKVATTKSTAKKAAPATGSAVKKMSATKDSSTSAAKKVAVIAKPTLQVKQPDKKNVSVEREKPLISKSEEKALKTMAVKKVINKVEIVKDKEISKKTIEKPVVKAEKSEKPEKIEKTDKKSVKASLVTYHPEFTKSVLDQPAPVNGPVYRYSDIDLQEFRELIQKKLESAKKELIYLQGLITRKDEAGTDDTENKYMSMEDGSGSQEREQLNQMASRQIQFIDHLEKAIVRIENKTYGICRVTGKLIDKARLRAVPHATLSIEAKLAKSK